MEESNETTVRRTRSGSAKATKTSPVASKTIRQKPGPLSRKTRKKVVLMEVEVSDDEKNQSSEEKMANKEIDKSEESLVTSDENLELNGGSNNSAKDEQNVAKADDVILNDVVMLQDDIEDQQNSPKAAEKMEVDKIIDFENFESIMENKSENSEENEAKSESKIKLTEETTAEEKIIELDIKDEPDKKKIKLQFLADVKDDVEIQKVEVQTPEKVENEKVVEVKLKAEEKVEQEEENNSNETILMHDSQIKTETFEQLEERVPEKLEKEVKETNEIPKEAKSDDEEKEVEKKEEISSDNQQADPDAENISEDELPTVQAVKVPEAEEVSDEELPGPKRAELPADTEVVSEDELPSVKTEIKKQNSKRKLNETDYDPGSPTSENEAPSKKLSIDTSSEKEKEDKPKPKKLPELDKYWKAVNDDPSDFTGWTYLLQYVDQENDMEAAREAYDAFLSHYPYCYGYWRKYADYEKRKGNKKKCEEVFERGLKAIPLSVDLWIHYLTYVKSTRAEDEEFIRSQFERALSACGLEFRSDRLWDSYIKWESEGKRLQKITAIYDRLLATPTQGYTAHFDNFQEHISSNTPNKVIDVDEFLALRKEVRQQLKHDVTGDAPPADNDAPPGDDDQSKVISSDEETKALRERIISIRRKAHKNTVNAVTVRWNYEEGIKRPYFHVKPLERCQLKNWQDYLDFETEQGERVRVIVLFERCLIACALYEEFWLKFVHYLESLNDPELQNKIRDVYERACTIHHLKKPNLHLQWAMFEESINNPNRAAEILVNLEKSVPNVLQIAYRRINLERRRGDVDKCCQLYEHYINTSKNKMIASSISIKYSRFTFVIAKDINKAQEILKSAIAKDTNNPRLYLQLIDLTLQKENVTEEEVISTINLFLEKESTEPEQKVLFAQRKLEYLEDFGNSIKAVQEAHDQYQKYLKLNKEGSKKKETKSDAPAPSSKSKETKAPPASSQSSSYGNYVPYGNSSNQPSYPPYSGNQQGPNYYPQYGQGNDQYQYQNWQYPPQGGYGGYNQWGGYSGGYGY